MGWAVGRTRGPGGGVAHAPCRRSNVGRGLLGGKGTVRGQGVGGKCLLTGQACCWRAEGVVPCRALNTPLLPMPMPLLAGLPVRGVPEGRRECTTGAGGGWWPQRPTHKRKRGARARAHTRVCNHTYTHTYVHQARWGARGGVKPYTGALGIPHSTHSAECPDQGARGGCCHCF